MSHEAHLLNVTNVALTGGFAATGRFSGSYQKVN